MTLHLPARRANKYGAQATTLDGIRFDSKKEARRYAELLLLQRAGEIRDLERQVEFPLLTTHHRGAEVHRVGSYFADFQYREGPTGILRIEDAKSPATAKNPLYRLKRKMVMLAYSVEIIEV